MRQLKVGVQVRPNHVSFSEMRAAWTAADLAGADSIWTFDHFFPIAGDLSGSSFECWTTLGAMAEVTKHAQIGALVSCYGYRNPDLLADMARTVDHASGGRLIMGLGAGWLDRDYSEYGYEFPSDGQRLRELGLAIPRIKDRLKRLNPRPMGSLPLMIGGRGERVTLRIVAEHADLWNCWGTTDEVCRLNSVLDAWCEKMERNPDEIERTVALFETGTDAMYDDYVASGVTHLILVVSGPDYAIADLDGLLKWRDSRTQATVIK